MAASKGSIETIEVLPSAEGMWQTGNNYDRPSGRYTASSTLISLKRLVDALLEFVDNSIEFTYHADQPDVPRLVTLKVVPPTEEAAAVS